MQRLRELGNRRRLFQVQLAKRHLARQTLRLGDRLLGAFLVDVAEIDVAAGLREGQHGRPSDARRSARHDHRLPCEIHLVVSRRPSWFDRLTMRTSS